MKSTTTATTKKKLEVMNTKQRLEEWWIYLSLEICNIMYGYLELRFLLFMMMPTWQHCAKKKRNNLQDLYFLKPNLLIAFDKMTLEYFVFFSNSYCLFCFLFNIWPWHKRLSEDCQRIKNRENKDFFYQVYHSPIHIPLDTPGTIYVLHLIPQLPMLPVFQ